LPTPETEAEIVVAGRQHDSVALPVDASRLPGRGFQGTVQREIACLERLSDEVGRIKRSGMYPDGVILRYGLQRPEEEMNPDTLSRHAFDVIPNEFYLVAQDDAGLVRGETGQAALQLGP